MGTELHQHFILYDKKGEPELEMYINADGNIFAKEANNEGGFSFVLNKEDWEEMKKFIDGLLENN